MKNDSDILCPETTPRPLRALIVTPTYPAADDPQSGLFIHRQVVNLIGAGIECHVLSLRPTPPPFPRWLLRPGWVRYHLHSLYWPGAGKDVVAEIVFYRRAWSAGEDVVPEMGRALVQWIERHPEWQNVDVVYAQFLWTAGAAALALRERFGWPVVAIARGGEMEQWHATNAHCRRYVEQVLKVADRPLANCRALRDKAERLVPGSAARIEVVYNGCDTDFFCPPADKALVRQRLGIGDRERLAVFCGSIEPVKGVQDLAEAWPGFSERHPEWRLVLVGKCVDRLIAARLRSSGLGRVMLTGELPQTGVLAWLHAADLYIQPSRLEGLANATMEAMATGLPVITTDVGGQGELIRPGENGWLLPPGDWSILLSALNEAAADLHGARCRGTKARRTIQTMFDAREQAENLVGILKRTASLRVAS